MPDNSFDVVLSALGLMYVPNPELAIGEMHRTLKEGGTAAAAVWVPRANCGWAAIFPSWMSVKTEGLPFTFSARNRESLKGHLNARVTEPAMKGVQVARKPI